MDVEPLVREERRNVSLEPLAAAFSHLQRLAVSDASFTRDPWSLQQLAWLPKLCNVSLAWDTGLWAPGQVLLEAEALQVCVCVCWHSTQHSQQERLCYALCWVSCLPSTTQPCAPSRCAAHTTQHHSTLVLRRPCLLPCSHCSR